MANPVPIDRLTLCRLLALNQKVFHGEGGTEEIAAIWNCALLEGCGSAAQCREAAIKLIRDRADDRHLG